MDLKKIRKPALITAIVSVILSVGQIMAAVFTQRLIDRPQYIWAVALGIVWITSRLLLSTKEYFLSNYYAGDNWKHKARLFEVILYFPFAFIETKEYADDFSRLKDKVLLEKKAVDSIVMFTTALCGFAGVFFLLFRTLPVGGVFCLLIFFAGMIFLSLSVSR